MALAQQNKKPSLKERMALAQQNNSSEVPQVAKFELSPEFKRQSFEARWDVKFGERDYKKVDELKGQATVHDRQEIGGREVLVFANTRGEYMLKEAHELSFRQAEAVEKEHSVSLELKRTMELPEKGQVVNFEKNNVVLGRGEAKAQKHKLDQERRDQRREQNRGKGYDYSP